ncbi:MAG: alpha/beta hydrolase fold [Frankiales bacterium]|nr:alpha/beta hydrolase fold [Frankiales bacterium]
MTVRTVTVADTRFLLREEGSGPGTPVLLLHGVPETSSVWRDVAPHLAVGRRVLAPDLPGLGGSSYAGPFDVPSLVAQFAALIEAEASGAVDVVGHDWGGSLALGLAGERPDLVRRLCVANAPFREIPLHRAVHIPFFALPAVPELVFRLGGRRVVDLMLSVAWKSAKPLDDERRAEYEAAYTDPDKVAAMLGYYRAAARPRLQALLNRTPMAGAPKVKVEKSLVLWGALDPVLPIATGESVVRDLGADCVMVTVPGAGHFVIEEAPAVVNDVLLDFLRDDAAQSAPAKKAPAKSAPAKKAPAESAPAKSAPARKAVKRAPVKKAAVKAPAKKTAPSSAPEAPPSPGTP